VLGHEFEESLFVNFHSAANYTPYDP
jgi:hypothetical protein